MTGPTYLTEPVQPQVRRPPANPRSGPEQDVLALQHQAGNAATAGLLTRSRDPLVVQRVTKVKVPDRRTAIDLDLLTDDELLKLVEQLEGTAAHGLVVTLDGETGAQLLARAKKKHDARQQVTQGFNVRGRAEDTGRVYVFTDNSAITMLAASMDLGAHRLAEEKEYDFSGFTLVVDQPALKTRCWAKAPVPRGPRDLAAPAPAGKAPPMANKAKHTTPKLKLSGPCKRGDESKARDAAMGGFSALRYAQAVKLAGAEQHTWEWLHLVGSALGGANVEGNLVAGTYDANTLMIPLEQTIVEYSKRPDVTPADPAYVWAEATLWENTWVATQITLYVQHGHRAPFWLGPITLKTDRLTKFEYDFYRWVFQRMAGNA